MRPVNDCIVWELWLLKRMAIRNLGAALVSSEVRRLANVILKPHLNALRKFHEAPPASQEWHLILLADDGRDVLCVQIRPTSLH